ncbi:hypothetical protein BXZ70DRAFT_1065629 [Cristinia sonorae]|uniref:Uncharacterized protein n=1 Tax=Cristinia sonorae TaxID=1940300 RepID=A0A8K0UKS4_9AGAR|nr:hypothetical protein BXZ70DRAFT_1065629 [Cristinia sonorae]
MLNLIRARIPSIILFTSLETALWGFVAFQWREPSELKVPLRSAIPAGHIGSGRFRLGQTAYAHA